MPDACIRASFHWLYAAAWLRSGMPCLAAPLVMDGFGCDGAIKSPACSCVLESTATRTCAQSRSLTEPRAPLAEGRGHARICGRSERRCGHRGRPRLDHQ